MNKLKMFLKSNQRLLQFAAGIYSFPTILRSLRFRYDNCIIMKGVFLKKCYFSIKGNNNQILIGAGTKLRNCSFKFIGDNCKISIGKGLSSITNTFFWCEDNGSCIEIGDDFTMEGGHLAATEGEKIIIGNDCMFSKDIEVRNGDSHSILDLESGERINYAEQVVIGNHVWITANVKILKGSFIPNNTIIGNNSLISRKLESENSVYAGIPVKIIKKNVNWDRKKL